MASSYDDTSMAISNIIVGIVGYVVPAVLAMVAVNRRLDQKDGSGERNLLFISTAILGAGFLYESYLLMKHGDMRLRRAAGVVAIGLIAASFGIMADSSDRDNVIGGINFTAYDEDTDAMLVYNATALNTDLNNTFSGKPMFDPDCLENMLTPSILDFGVSGTRTSNMMFVAGFALAAVASVTLIGEKVERTILPKELLTAVSLLVSLAIFGLGGAVVGLHRRLPEKYDYLDHTDTRGHDIFSTRSLMMKLMIAFITLIAIHDVVDMLTRGSGKKGANHKKFYMVVVMLSWVATIIAIVGARYMLGYPSDESLYDRLVQIGESMSVPSAIIADGKADLLNQTRDVPPSVMACTEGTYDDYETGSILISFAIPAAILHAWRSVCLNDFVTPGESLKVTSKQLTNSAIGA